MAKRPDVGHLVRAALRLAVCVPLIVLAGCDDLTPGACKDVTTYDYNWDNDMKCMRRDGTIFYTNYEGARRFEASN